MPALMSGTISENGGRIIIWSDLYEGLFIHHELYEVRRSCLFGSCPDSSAFGRLRPAGGDERQDFFDQPAGLRHHLVVTLCGRAQDEFRHPGLDIFVAALDDR